MYSLAKIKEAVMDSLMVSIDYDNHGLLSTRKLRESSWDVLRSCDVRIDRRNNVVRVGGVEVWSIQRRFSARKVNLCYPELKPTLIELEGAAALRKR